MSAVNLTVEVHCLKPIWAMTAGNSYRLYVNNDLFTERNWRWSVNTLINENIWLDIPDISNTYSIRLEPVLLFKSQDSSVTQFALRNLQVIDVPFTSTQINNLTISFTLQ